MWIIFILNWKKEFKTWCDKARSGRRRRNKDWVKMRRCPGLKSLIPLHYLHSHAEGSLRIQRGWWSSSCLSILIFHAIFIVFIRSIFLYISWILTELLLFLRLLLSHHIRDTRAQQQAQTQPCNHTDTHSINWSDGGVSAERQTADMSCAALDIINLTNMHRRNNYANPVLEHSSLIASSVWSRTLAFAFCCTRNAKNLYFSTCFRIYTIINH